jgi:hypothetical protein
LQDNAMTKEVLLLAGLLHGYRHLDNKKAANKNVYRPMK